jgi:ribonuclease HII
MAGQALPDYRYENAHMTCGRFPVVGVDEVGRGPLAGPVIAAAVIVRDPSVVAESRDSKTLSPTKREQLYARYADHSGLVWSIGEASVEEIDAVNILQATKLAMVRALHGLGCALGMVLVDGRPFKEFPWPHEGIVGGDRKSLSIATASIMAKVTRDRIMERLDKEFPGYGFAQNKGYGSAAHLEAIRVQGISPHHRKTFGPCRPTLF